MILWQEQVHLKRLRGEAFVFVPGKILITVEKAKSSEIGYIFSSHDKIFKSTADREFLILLVYMIYENQKGKDSFWFPYFDAINPIELPNYWGEKYLEELDDYELKKFLYNNKVELDDDWDLLLKLFKVYPKHFDLGKCTFEVYKRYASFI